MRTNIVLNDALVAEAQSLCDIKTKRELVEEALKEFIANRRRLDMRKPKGTKELSADHDYKSAR